METGQEQIAGAFKRQPTASQCCLSPLHKLTNTKHYQAQLCSECGSLWVDHKTKFGNGSWTETNLSGEFMESLVFRRHLQAEKIFNRFSGVFSEGPVLDYSCGTGQFIRFMRSKGVSVFGCDLYLPKVADDVSHYIQKLSRGWELPNFPPDIVFKTMTILDVVEHMTEPREFFGRVRAETGIEYLLVKTPNYRGPIAAMAKALARVGRPEILDSLLLVGDHSPHLSYFTPLGLRNLVEASGWLYQDEISLAEVGRELPHRMRGEVSKLQLSRVILSVGGLALSGISPIWSDTICMLFRRRA